MNHDTELVRSYGRCARGRSQVYKPVTVDDVKEVFALARRDNRRIVIRGGGHSFDGQALHNGDDGGDIVLSSSCLESQNIEFSIDPATGERLATLGAGVSWGAFVSMALQQSQASGQPIRVPGSLQTGRYSTVAGTLSGDCLSRFSGLGGKESAYVRSFRILTPTSDGPVQVTEESDPDLFHAVIAGCGYFGVITEVTYRLIEIPAGSVARTTITICDNFHDLIQSQLDLIRGGVAPRAVSSAWYTDLVPNLIHPHRIKGAVFDSVYAQPSDPPLPPFPLYEDIDGSFRYWVETMLGRHELSNWTVHEALYHLVQLDNGLFEDALYDFIFFMDGDAVAKRKYEQIHFPDQFPIMQQTFVLPTLAAEDFSRDAMSTMHRRGIRPTECDMLFVKADQCLMSANYKMDGFAITIGFEPVAPAGCPSDEIVRLLRDLSADCAAKGGRIHLTKNVAVDPAVFREMFSPQISKFEAIKAQHDPDLLIQNPFSDTFFRFGAAAPQDRAAFEAI